MTQKPRRPDRRRPSESRKTRVPVSLERAAGTFIFSYFSLLLTTPQNTPTTFQHSAECWNVVELYFFDSHEELTSPSLAFALGPNGPAVRLNNLACNVEPEAGAADFFFHALVADEFVKKMRQ